jgi:hypothetical protein
MRGLDPRISSAPPRDGRVKPGHDEKGKCSVWRNPLSIRPA